MAKESALYCILETTRGLPMISNPNIKASSTSWHSDQFHSDVQVCDVFVFLLPPSKFTHPILLFLLRAISSRVYTQWLSKLPQITFQIGHLATGMYPIAPRCDWLLLAVSHLHALVRPSIRNFLLQFGICLALFACFNSPCTF